MHPLTTSVPLFVLLLGALLPGLAGAAPDDQYVPGPDSQPHPGVPQGYVFDFRFEHSRVFPGTSRKITVYVPAQYTGERPACVYVGLDALAFAAPSVFDNLIARGEMPVTIGIGVAPGEVPSSRPGENPRFNRSLEFDGLNGNLARCLLEEIFPAVERQTTPRGIPLRLSQDPNDRAAGGASTGGIGAFTLAWERPDAFRRVFTAIGTFVGMRGGDRYPVLVRKTDPKPIRIFMQDGARDQLLDFLGEVGDWHLANLTMLSALQFAGYDVEHVWGEGTHNSKHATAIFPDAMRFLWKDWPRPVVARPSRNVILRQIEPDPAGWQVVPGPYRCDGGLVADPRGNLLFYDGALGKVRQLTTDGQWREAPWQAGPGSALAFGPDGRAYVSEPASGRILAYAPDGTATVIGTGLAATALLATHGGNLYVLETAAEPPRSGQLWLITPQGEKRLLDSGLAAPRGVAISPDGHWLAVAESRTHGGYSYRVNADATVSAKQLFYWFHVPDTADDSGAGNWLMDRAGLLYGATRLGVQIFDRNGRSRAILPLPGGGAEGVAFGGSDFKILYAVGEDHRLYARHLKAAGAQPWAAPIPLPAGNPG